MKLTKLQREQIKMKFGGRCAYSGTELLSDWQIDHKEPIIRGYFAFSKLRPEYDKLDNLLPCQRIINHYKGNRDVEQFRKLLMTLHIRLSKLPKSPTSERPTRRKNYLLEVAKLFDITAEKPFNGLFYFEKINNHAKYCKTST